MHGGREGGRKTRRGGHKRARERLGRCEDLQALKWSAEKGVAGVHNNKEKKRGGPTRGALGIDEQRSISSFKTRPFNRKKLGGESFKEISKEEGNYSAILQVQLNF